MLKKKKGILLKVLRKSEENIVQTIAILECCETTNTSENKPESDSIHKQQKDCSINRSHIKNRMEKRAVSYDASH